MIEAPFIARRPKAPAPQSFWGLRAQGLAASQALSGQVWTDFNLHDPGVTILEQVCYALTELVFRADHAVADHLTGEDGHIDFAALALHPPEVVFPCRPVTAQDLRRLLLDRIDGIEDAVVGAAPMAGAQPAGLWQVELRLRQGDAARASEASRQARALLRAHRNLCEDLESLGIVREHPCDLLADIEVASSRDPVDIVAEVYSVCAAYLAQADGFDSLDQALARGLCLEEIFDGPPMTRGLARETTAALPSARLFVSELIVAVRAIDGVAEVNRIALHREGEDAPSTQSVLRRGRGWALRLRVPRDDQDGVGMQVTRRGSKVPVPASLVHAKYEDLEASRSGRSYAGEHGGVAPAHPRGRYREGGRYCAVQDQFPPAYGINRHGVGTEATAHERAWSWQLKGYLALFDQVMAHSAAQLAHLRELFAVDSGPRQTYWWRMLDEDSIPGIGEKLYALPAAEIQDRVYRRADDFYERKGRVLDYLLALHGENYSQNSLRQFGGCYTARELRALLHANKAQFARDIIVLGRDRGAGFDDSRPCWDHADNASGLQRRVSLLLGFLHGHERPLVAAIERRGSELGHHPEHARSHWRRDPARLARLALERADLEAPHAQAGGEFDRLPAFGAGRMAETLLRSAAYPDRYWLDTAASGVFRLVVGPDEQGAYWHLGDHDSASAARRAAAGLRNLMLRLNRESEGLHVIEHLLLRPIGPSPSHHLARVPADFWSFQVTAAFARWPARCREPNFRRLAHETVELNCPAHVDAHCVWLEFNDMREFERLYQKWLAARMAWCNDAAQDDKLRVRMNHAAAELIRNLLAHHRRAEAEAAE